MWLDAIALILLVIFAWLGARRGALAAGLSFAGLVAGYIAAIFAGRAFGDAAASAFGVSPLLGAPIAGTIAFLFVTLDFALVSYLLRRRSDGTLTPASRAGGACFGLLRGSLVVLLLGVLALWTDALPQLTQTATDAPAADTPLRSVARAAVRTGVETALGRDKPGTELAARTLSEPGTAVVELRELAAAPEIAALAEDRAFWASVEAGDMRDALAQPSFQKIQWNAELRRELARLGVVDEIASQDPAVFALEMRAALTAIGPRIRELRNDPDLARLAADPAIVQLVERRDVVGLLANPRFQRVLSRALAPAPASG